MFCKGVPGICRKVVAEFRCGVFACCVWKAYTCVTRRHRVLAARKQENYKAEGFLSTRFATVVLHMLRDRRRELPSLHCTIGKRHPWLTGKNDDMKLTLMDSEGEAEEICTVTLEKVASN
ncbi:hypothetical protein E2C01_060221 [Portunus trituberculatus]|uniref:Uncharacterized protein n=1 Tax=Portunus trituberculatus TaxID=210409 RepID=A0A5B7HAS3_PORTR|nr:hypothetical protein [Portunus trituberculatus]